MAVRESFHSQLDLVKQQLLDMGTRVEEVMDQMIQSFASSNTNKMDEIIKNDYLINQLELSMHDQVTLLISRQQPVATDLRKLIVALKVSSDLERVADLIVDIAKQSKRMKENSLLTFQVKIIAMYTIAQEMLTTSLDAFKHTDLLQAQKIAGMDDKVDQLYGELIRELFTLKDAQIEIDQITQLAFIGRYIERIADYATNIAEWVIYEVNGRHFDLN
ncbi:phosphate transport system regulatory protein PhoU [Halalkalibacter wakoensis JCM 9140]|uniref:Phosphate-specific transport system accessory protein PhoU n=1 Tax=Halalkalibacter wakoensis JCM 9140 TaxID=1236970 RepID=W4Q2J5_9BACI|nr:phosphate signaling complex protein PhoU [Halalkalibacter wakoensis]GAE26306.1 phosphate transport system regulatory protein PhoU [Halalkalibacter wakoensis JCM 9140]